MIYFWNGSSALKNPVILCSRVVINGRWPFAWRFKFCTEGKKQTFAGLVCLIIKKNHILGPKSSSIWNIVKSAPFFSWLFEGFNFFRFGSFRYWKKVLIWQKKVQSWQKNMVQIWLPFCNKKRCAFDKLRCRFDIFWHIIFWHPSNLWSTLNRSENQISCSLSHYVDNRFNAWEWSTILPVYLELLIAQYSVFRLKIIFLKICFRWFFRYN